MPFDCVGTAKFAGVGTTGATTEAYIRHWLMRYYLDLVKIISQYEIITAWYEITKTCYAKIIRYMRYYNEIMQYLSRETR